MISVPFAHVFKHGSDAIKRRPRDKSRAPPTGLSLGMNAFANGTAPPVPVINKPSAENGVSLQSLAAVNVTSAHRENGQRIVI